MREASVGFQCPECVKSGQAAVRAAAHPRGRGDLHERRRDHDGDHRDQRRRPCRGQSRPAACATPARASSSAGRWSAGSGVADGEYWRLVTAAFLHGGVLHLAFNMYALYLFGPFVEQTLGHGALRRRLPDAGDRLVGAGLPARGPAHATIGASGAVFGLFGLALVLLHPHARRTSPALLVLLAINAVHQPRATSAGRATSADSSPDSCSARCSPTRRASDAPYPGGHLRADLGALPRRDRVANRRADRHLHVPRLSPGSPVIHRVCTTCGDYRRVIHSHFMAKPKAARMKPMPMTRFQPPRSL